MLAGWGWPVLSGRPLRSKTEMRVMADTEPKKLTISSGGKVPYVLRREFPAAASAQVDHQQVKATKPTKNMEDNSKGSGESEKMEEDDCQTQINEQMQGFLNAEAARVSTPSSPSSASPQAATPSTVRPPCPQEIASDYKKDMNDLKQEIAQMMKTMEERQNQAELRQDATEKRIEVAISEIVSEHKSTAASTMQDVGDLKSMMALMVQQQNALVQQQSTMMQMLQGDDRRVKPKVEAQTAQ